MAGRGLGAADLDAGVLAVFAEEERSRCAGAAAAACAGVVRGFLASRGLVEAAPPRPARVVGLVPVRVGGPLAVLAERFASYLAGLGHVVGSARNRGSVLMRLSRWMGGRGLGLSDLSGPVVAEFFAAEARGGHPASAACGSSVWAFLAEAGLVARGADPVPAPAPGDAVLDEFCRYLLAERALAAPTVESRRVFLARFAASLCDESGAVSWDGVDADSVMGYLAERGRGLAPSTRGLLGCAMRSFLRWAYVDGRLAADLRGAVLSPRNSADRGVPRGLPIEDVAAALASIDRSDATGLRDFAVVTVFYRLGLRAAEVAGLGLDSIDWRAGTLTARVKGPKALTLPLPVDVGEALAAYLQHGRPAGALGREVFIRSHAPLSGLTGSGASQIVGKVFARAGLGRVAAHRLRHTAATRIVGGGGSLAEAGQVLGHASDATTRIYAGADTASLRRLCRGWAV
jgi:site-specific recombinase XerD